MDEGYKRRPWRNPPHLASRFILELVWYHTDRNGDELEPWAPYWGAQAVRRAHDKHAGAERVEVLLLYRAGAIGIMQRERKEGQSHGQRRAMLTPEALRHPDVVELLWTNGGRLRV